MAATVTPIKICARPRDHGDSGSGSYSVRFLIFSKPSLVSIEAASFGFRTGMLPKIISGWIQPERVDALGRTQCTVSTGKYTQAGRRFVGCGRLGRAFGTKIYQKVS
jgi:hypothetical protein